MSGAQALLSIPVSQAPVAPRDAGGAVQDVAQAEAAGSAFETALETVDQRNSPAGSSDDMEDDGAEAPADETVAVSQQATVTPVSGGLAAALAQIGMPWAQSAPVQTGDAMQDGGKTVTEADPLALLARAIAANDSEPAMNEAPVSEEAMADEFVDVRILGRERHLAVGEAKSLDVVVASAVNEQAITEVGGESGDARALQAALDVDAPVDAEAIDVPKPLQRVVADAAAALQPAAAQQVTAGAAAKSETMRQTKLLDGDGETEVRAADGSVIPAAAEDGEQTAKPHRVITKPQADLNGSAGRLIDSGAPDRDMSSDADPAREKEFSTLMQRPADGLLPTVKIPAAETSGTVTSPASQIADQLATPQAREVISTVQTSGDTKVIEIELNPHNLGSVTVRVSLKDDVISLKLEAARADTAQEIAREVDKLANNLKQAGYVVDGISAQQMDPRTVSRLEAASGSSASGGNSQQGQAQTSGQGQAFQGNGSGSQQNGQGRAPSGGFEGWASGPNNEGQNNGLASERQTGLYV